jgi:hypothetical protein
VAPRQSFVFRVKKQINDMLRRLTGYQFVKADKIEALEARARAAKSSRAGRG